MSLLRRSSPSCTLAVQLSLALTLLWIRTSSGQEENCKEFTLDNGLFEVCLSTNQKLALGARPILTCNLSPDNTNACSFSHWELNGSDVTIASPNYLPLNPKTTHGVSFRIEAPSPAVGGTYRCSYSCNNDSNIIYSELELQFFPSVEFTTPDNLMYWGEVGSTITLNCSIIFYTKFLWKYDNDTTLAVHTSIGSPRQELDGTSLTLKDLVVSDNNTYRCSAKNMVTSDTFIRAYLFVYLRPRIEEISDAIITAEGNRTVMTCIAHAVPKPSIVWSKETDLTFGGRFQEETVNVDDYTVKSTLIITHTASSDQGIYHCTAFNKNGTSGQFGTVKEMIELTVEVPVGPFLEAFNTSTNATSITVEWIVSGVPNIQSITVEWKFLNGTLIDVISGLPQEPAEFVISSLSPEASYVITVKAGVLEYNVTVDTPPIPVPMVISSTSITSVALPSSTASVLPSMFIARSPSSSEEVTPSAPVSVASSNEYIVFSTVIAITVLVALVVITIMIVVMIVVLKKKSGSAKSIEHNGSTQKLPYSNNSPPSYRQQMSGSSMTSLPTIATMVSQDSSSLPYPSQHSFTAMDFAAVQGLTGRAQLTALNSHAMVDSVGFISSTPPGHGQVVWTVGQPPPHMGIGPGAQHEAFEMTENPANLRFEMEKSLAQQQRQHLAHLTPEPGPLLDGRPGSIPAYLGSESASQVHLHSSHSMPRGVASLYNHTYPDHEEAFEYVDNVMYEQHTLPTAQGQKGVTREALLPRRSLTSCSSLDSDSPRFKIISRERGAVFEEVTIKPQP